MSTRALVLVVSLVAVAVTAVCAVTLVILLRPPASQAPTTTVSSGDGPHLVIDQDDQPDTGGGQVQERTEAAVRQAAQDLFDSYAAGNYGAFWDGWTRDAQALISRDDYVRLFDLCKPIAQGIRFDIKRVTVEGDTARVEVTRLIGAFTYDMRFEDGRWKYIPDAQAQADYKTKSIDQIAADKRAARACAP